MLAVPSLALSAVLPLLLPSAEGAGQSNGSSKPNNTSGEKGASTGDDGQLSCCGCATASDEDIANTAAIICSE